MTLGPGGAAATWRHRLNNELRARHETMRSASLKAGLGHNYLHGVLKNGKDMTVDRFLAVARALDADVHQILIGVASDSAEVAEIARRAAKSPQRVHLVLALFREMDGVPTP